MLHASRLFYKCLSLCFICSTTLAIAELLTGKDSFWRSSILISGCLASMMMGLLFMQKRMNEKVPCTRKQEEGKPDTVMAEQLRYLTDMKQRLEQQLDDQAVQLNRYFLKQLFLGGYTQPELQTRLAAIGGAPDRQNPLAVMTYRIESLEHTRFSENDRELLLFAIRNVIEELIPSSSRLTPVSIEERIVLLAAGRDQDHAAFRAMLDTWVDRVRTAVSEYLSLTISVGVSSVFVDRMCIPAAYQESLEAFKYRIWTHSQPVYYYEHTLAESAGGYPLPHELEQEWLEAVKHCEIERADNLLHQVVKEMVRNAGSPQMLELSMVRLLFAFLEHMRQWGILYDVWRNSRTSLIQQVIKLQSEAEIECWFKQVLMDPCLTTLEGNMKSYKKNLLDQIVTMIREEYDTDLSLETVAARLHYNPNYLSGLFNKEMNITFSEYLAKQRHDMARKWLIETGLPVKEIAYKLQYKNSQNFIRSFRKGQGMTPGEFRMKYGRKPLFEEMGYLAERTSEPVFE